MRFLKSVLLCMSVLFFVQSFNCQMALSAEGISPTNRQEAHGSLIPYPRQVKWSEQDFAPRSVSISYAKTLQDSFLSTSIESVFRGAGISVQRVERNRTRPKSMVQLKLEPVPGTNDNPEAYRLVVTPEKIVLSAPNSGGLFYGIQTLRQLMQNKKGKNVVPCCEITDWPAFKIRGFMHDVGRNFQDVQLIKRHLDMMAFYKMNLFHFHLTDRPGFRIESKKYPQLNDPKNYRSTRQPGKFYTYKQINELIEYARQRNIQIMPEIDMPGHSEYFNETFGFGMQDARGVAILKEILKEFFENVNTPLFHMGSDEVRLKNPQFMKEIADYIRSQGKELVVWRPGHMPDEQVITQLWSRGPKPLAGVKYLDSRANYINHMDALVGPVRVFFQQPCSVLSGNDMALGGILCHWPDNNINTQMDIYSQSPVYPAMVAYAERIWRGANYDNGKYWAKLPAIDEPAFQEFAEFEKDMIVHRDRFFNDTPFPYISQSNFPWKLIGPFDHKADPQKQFHIETAIHDEYEIDGKIYKWKEARGGTIHINHFFGFTGHLPAAKKGTAYGLTYVYSPKDQEVSFWIGFNGSSRSGRRGGSNPTQGQWSNTYSKVWVNDKSVSPPKWDRPGIVRKSSETPFTDDDYFYRQPIEVPLKKGWNKILVKAPKAAPAWKWMFTCVPVQTDGNGVKEKKGLKFSLTPDMAGGGK